MRLEETTIVYTTFTDSYIVPEEKERRGEGGREREREGGGGGLYKRV